MTITSIILGLISTYFNIIETNQNLNDLILILLIISSLQICHKIRDRCNDAIDNSIILT